MKPSSLIALICSLAINGISTFNQPAAAQPSPQSFHVAEAATAPNSDDDEADEDETDGFVVVRDGKKYGYDDAKGNQVIAPKFDNAYDFFDGLAAVKIDGKWGFIDGDGELVIQTKFDGATSFNSGLAAVKINGKWGFIDEDGTTAYIQQVI